MSFHHRLTSAILLFAVIITSAEAATISGAGGKRCGDFIQAVDLKSEVAINGYVSWAQGFLSGYNWLNAHGHDVVMDPGGLNYFLVNYCGAHKDMPFYKVIVKDLAPDLGWCHGSQNL